MLDKAEYSAFQSTLNSPIVSYRIVSYVWQPFHLHIDPQLIICYSNDHKISYKHLLSQYHHCYSKNTLKGNRKPVFKFRVDRNDRIRLQLLTVEVRVRPKLKARWSQMPIPTEEYTRYWNPGNTSRPKRIFTCS